MGHKLNKCSGEITKVEDKHIDDKIDRLLKTDSDGNIKRKVKVF